MLRDGAIILVCEPCGRRGRYAVARLIAERGDAKLTDLLPALASRSKRTNAASIYDRCRAGFEATIPRYDDGLRMPAGVASDLGALGGLRGYRCDLSPRRLQGWSRRPPAGQLPTVR
jgi:hypothetical protein